MVSKGKGTEKSDRPVYIQGVPYKWEVCVAIVKSSSNRKKKKGQGLRGILYELKRCLYLDGKILMSTSNPSHCYIMQCVYPFMRLSYFSSFLSPSPTSPVSVSTPQPPHPQTPTPRPPTASHSACARTKSRSASLSASSASPSPSPEADSRSAPACSR